MKYDLNGWKTPLISFLTACLVSAIGYIMVAISTQLDHMATEQKQQGEQIARLEGQLGELKTLVQLVIGKNIEGRRHDPY